MTQTALRGAGYVALCLLAGCTQADSVLTPEGPRAAEIARLAWVLFILCTAIFVIVMAATALALRGPQQIRAWLADRNAIVAGGIIFPAVTLTLLLGYGVWLMHAGARSASDNPMQIEVTGEQWWWRVAYAAPGGQTIASANEIVIPSGREVLFTLKSADVIHSFWVPSLGGKVDMIPGRITQLRLVADRAGIYRGQCAEYCGGPHALMAIKVIAMPAAGFENWLTREAAPAIVPIGDTERRGQALFVASGCGACHTIRGTDAAGKVGPDLTHVGARLSVGIDTLPMTHANLARFVSDGQHIKPGNLMPQFRIFSGEERDAVAAYLLSLR